jgi:hypothetical protein
LSRIARLATCHGQSSWLPLYPGLSTRVSDISGTMKVVAACAYIAQNTAHRCDDVFAQRLGSGCEALNRECGIGNSEYGSQAEPSWGCSEPQEADTLLFAHESCWAFQPSPNWGQSAAHRKVACLEFSVWNSLPEFLDCSPPPSFLTAGGSRCERSSFASPLWAFRIPHCLFRIPDSRHRWHLLHIFQARSCR